MDKIKKVSRAFRIIFQILFYLLPIFLLSFWLLFQSNYDIFTPLGIGADFLYRPVTINVLTRVLAFCAGMIPVGIQMFGLRQLIKLFKNYEIGNIFSLESVTCYRRLGYTLFAWIIGKLIYVPLITFIVSFQNVGPHSKYIVIGIIHGGDLATIISGALILLIAWVMKEAQLLSEEQSLTI